MTGQQLKNSILQWAIQGKLVPQDPTDEPASKLLERIRTEKAQLIKEGKLKKGQPTSHIYRDDEGSYYEKVGSKEPVCINHEIPFDLPSGWEWCRLGSLVDFSINQSVKADEISKDAWLLDLEDIEKNTGALLQRKRMGSTTSISNKHRFIEGNVLYSKLRPYLNKVIIADEDGYCTSEILCLDFGLVFNKYAQVFLMSPLFVEYAMSCAYGVKMPRLGSKHGNNALFALPPLEEQKRIVARIEELMPLVEQYDKAHSELTRLNDQLPEQLKKSILQEAIQGKLVPQDPTDEPASELLERIRTEKAQLIKEGKMKKGQPTSHIYRDDEGSYYEKVGTKDPVCINHEIPFDLPASWEWCRLSDIAVYIQRGKSPKYSLIKKYPVVAQKCNQWDGFLIDKAKFIDPATLSKYTPERFLQDEDLMWNSTGLGTLGRMAVYYTALNPYELAVADSHVTVIRLLKSCVDPSFCYFYFINPTVQSVIEIMSDGSTKQRELSTTTVRNFLVPLPPLEEQKRIVARIEELMPRIDKLR
ncbi:restriction endonuclease subunit S [uncultured Porphyromonas sp.]|uniref:restriction endonuclease subunit S n=1 Tax=uncultured Porphyromonas sp. TaxID=159274 RepID=UPI0025935D53|nr:restriction endonuclease subunit S [uncultured Porphyromonas sp.]